MEGLRAAVNHALCTVRDTTTPKVQWGVLLIGLRRCIVSRLHWARLPCGCAALRKLLGWHRINDEAARCFPARRGCVFPHRRSSTMLLREKCLGSSPQRVFERPLDRTQYCPGPPPREPQWTAPHQEALHLPHNQGRRGRKGSQPEQLKRSSASTQHTTLLANSQVRCRRTAVASGEGSNAAW